VYRFAASTGRLEAVVSVGATAGAMAGGGGGVWGAEEGKPRISRSSVGHNRVRAAVSGSGGPSPQRGRRRGRSGTGRGPGGGGCGGGFVDGAGGGVFPGAGGREPCGGAASGDAVGVANTADGTLSRIDGRQHMVVATVSVGLRPYALAADRSGVWAALLGRA